MNMALITAGSIFSWLLMVAGVWMVVSLIMFVFSMGQFSPLDGARFQNYYWKWSILIAVYLSIPFIGWLAGAIHLKSSFSKWLNEKPANQNYNQN